ncbi:MAG TPA: cation:proton antiporter [Nocardioidaceae bacterium]|nr:cation:proton antiporter [Nocardioidaceae bacterium]
MDIPVGLESFFWIVLAAALAPLIVGLLPGPKVPEVVILLLLGMVIGPEALGLATKEGPILLLNDVGLGFLFFIAGYELNPRVLKGRTGLQAATSWAVSMALALSVVGVLYEIGYVKAFLPVAIALTSTALGTLLPILRDAGLLDTKLGRLVVANGAVGEFGPVLAISLFLGSRGAWASLVILLVFAVIAVAIDRIPRVLVTRRISAIFEHGSETTQQTTLRWTVLLLVGLLLMAAEFGLDVILGAFAAGLILRQLTPDGDEALEHKLDGIAFGLFVPLFFVTSGIQVDVTSIIQNPGRLAVFFFLIAAIRGLPVLVIFSRDLHGRELVRLGLFTATGLPIIVAVTQIGLATGIMIPENAAALVGAGVISVLVFPLTAELLGRKSERTDAAVEPSP